MSPPTSSRLQRQAWPSDMLGGGLGAARPTAGRVERQSAGVNCSSQEWRARKTGNPILPIVVHNAFPVCVELPSNQGAPGGS